MTSYNIEEMVEELVLECDDDYIGLWRVPSELAENNVPHELLLEKTLEVLQFLATNRSIVFGNPGDTAFIPWDLSTDVAIDRIAVEWKELGRPPDIGEIVWFTASSPDYSYAKTE